MGSACSLASGPSEGPSIELPVFERGKGTPPLAHLCQGGCRAQRSLGAGHGLAGQRCPRLPLHFSRHRRRKGTKIQCQTCGVQRGWKLGGGMWRYWRLWGGPYWGPRLRRGRRCPWTLGAARPPRSCGAAAGRSCGTLGPSLPEPVGGQGGGAGTGQHDRPGQMKRPRPQPGRAEVPAPR